MLYVVCCMLYVVCFPSQLRDGDEESVTVFFGARESAGVCPKKAKPLMECWGVGKKRRLLLRDAGQFLIMFKADKLRSKNSDQ